MTNEGRPKLFAPAAVDADWYVTSGSGRSPRESPALAIVAKVALRLGADGAVALRPPPRLGQADRTAGSANPTAKAPGLRVVARVTGPGCERTVELEACRSVQRADGSTEVTVAAATPVAGLTLGDTILVLGIAVNGHPTVWPSGEALRTPREHRFEEGHVRTGPILESDLAAAGLPFVPANPLLHPAERRSPTPPRLDGLPFRAPAAGATSKANDGPPAPAPARSGDTVPARCDGPFDVSTVVTCLRPPRHDLTVVVKASFDCVADAPAVLRPEPELLTGDVYEGDDPNGKLWVASDMAPLKTACDVLVYTAALRGGPVEAPHPVVVRVGAVGRATASRGLIERKTRRPAELGPISPYDPRRAKLLGTYDAKWLATRWPHFAADLDPRHFQAAPEAQRLEAAVGDESYEIVGASDARSRLRGELPGVRPVAVAYIRGGERRVVALRLDTVGFFVDEGRLDLVWRGILEVSDDDAPEVEHVFVTAVGARDAAPSLDEVDARRERSRRRISAPPPVPLEPEAPPPAAAVRDGEDEVEDPPTEDEADFTAAVAGLPKPDLEQMAASMREAGADEEAIADVLAGLAPEPEPPTDRAPVGGAAPPRDDVRAEVVRRLEAKESLDGLELAHADLSGLDLSGQDLTGRDLTGALLDGADLRGACIEDAELAGARLKAADLRGARAACAGFHHADLGGARFDGAQLEAADFTAAELDAAVFDDAHLASVRLYDVRAARASFRRANLSGSRAEGAAMPGACFAHAVLDGSVWERADLTKASFESASLRGASLVRALCDGAVFVLADLTRARLVRATAVGTSMIRANLFGANLDRADLRDVDMRGANLHGTSVQRTNLLGSRLEGAIVTYSRVSSRAP